MKNLLFLCGPNGIGKTTICKAIVRHLPNSAYVDSDPCRLMNPFILDEDTIPTIRKNISDLICNYFSCPIINTVIFSYGFHGRRKEIFNGIISDISHISYNFIPFLLVCDEEENIRRMRCDNRDFEKMKHTLKESRKAFNDLDYPQINITELSVIESVEKIINGARLI